MKYRYRLRCKYCHVDDYREELPHKNSTWNCKHCNDTKYEVKKLDEGDRNPFGYEEESKQDISEWYKMYHD